MKTTSRTISQIVRAHTLTYFNLLNVILAGFIILSGQYKNMLFYGNCHFQFFDWNYSGI